MPFAHMKSLFEALGEKKLFGMQNGDHLTHSKAEVYSTTTSFKTVFVRT